jgi:hypothetical protein
MVAKPRLDLTQLWLIHSTRFELKCNSFESWIQISSFLPAKTSTSSRLVFRELTCDFVKFRACFEFC